MQTCGVRAGTVSVTRQNVTRTETPRAPPRPPTHSCTHPVVLRVEDALEGAADGRERPGLRNDEVGEGLRHRHRDERRCGEESELRHLCTRRCYVYVWLKNWGQ
jgi:hypothetical protein